MLLLGSKVLVEFIESDEKTRSGLIWIPSEARDPSYTGIVLEIGPGQMNVRVGERIVFSRYAGVPLRGLDGRTKAVLDDQEILAVFRDDEVETMYRRVTYAVDGSQLPQLLMLDSVDVEVLKTQPLYVHYSHQANTLYVTYEVSNGRTDRI